jgi:riboflavin biosynthesis pyrimidine reductase
LLPDVPGEVDLVEAYAVPAGVPHLRVNFVASADGAATVDGRSEGLSNASSVDKELFFTLRGLADVVLVGAGTVRAEDYGPVRRSGTDHRPPIAVVTGRLALDPTSRFFAEVPPGQRPFLLTTASADAAPFADLAEVIVCGEHHVDLTLALAALRARGLARVVCEGGPTLFGHLVAGGLVDELDLSIAPLLCGPGGPRIAAGPVPPGPPAALELSQLLEDEAWLFARYSVRSSAGHLAPAGTP